MAQSKSRTSAQRPRATKTWHPPPSSRLVAACGRTSALRRGKARLRPRVRGGGYPLHPVATAAIVRNVAAGNSPTQLPVFVVVPNIGLSTEADQEFGFSDNLIYLRRMVFLAVEKNMSIAVATETDDASGYGARIPYRSHRASTSTPVQIVVAARLFGGLLRIKGHAMYREPVIAHRPTPPRRSGQPPGPAGSHSSCPGLPDRSGPSSPETGSSQACA